VGFIPKLFMLAASVLNRLQTRNCKCSKKQQHFL